MAQFHRRMNKEVRLAILEEGKKNMKKSDKKKRYREKNRLIREEKKQEREAFKKEKSEIIKNHTVSGVAPQAERPPQLNQIIDKMMKNNVLFEKEKVQPKMDHQEGDGYLPPQHESLRFDCFQQTQLQKRHLIALNRHHHRRIGRLVPSHQDQVALHGVLHSLRLDRLLRVGLHKPLLSTLHALVRELHGQLLRALSLGGGDDHVPLVRPRVHRPART